MDPAHVPSEEELNRLLQKTFTRTVRKGYTVVDNFILPERYHEMKKDINEFEVYDTDLWICGFPKTGTTWISEIAWLIVNNFDYEQAKLPDYKRTRMMEFSMLFDIKKEVLFGGEEYEMDSIGYAKSQNHPRTIKSHLPFKLLPQQISGNIVQPKIIYTARNTMDTCISYFHHCKGYEGFTGTFEEFSKLFLFDKVNYGPYYKHVLQFWELRHKPNIFFVTYEEMKNDITGIIQKVADFLGKTVSKEDVKRLQEYVSFDSMKENPAVNKEFVNKHIEATTGKKDAIFIREGKSGGYKNVMSQELIAQFCYWTDKRLQGSGLNLL
ncbi:luciferin sulfotransferase-like [Zophobas morio]|uniref:luciferin sulfotransferase-like n=1 Tax=Zophobas morio TaxID=2755281 RepID=UPI0030831390